MTHLSAGELKHGDSLDNGGRILDGGCQWMSVVAVRRIFWQPFHMADRTPPIRKTPAEILHDILDGHREALDGGPEKGRKYLLSSIERANSVPNAVKFILFDLLAEDSFRCDDLETCRASVAKASEYLPVAQQELAQPFRAYAACIRFTELGIGIALDDGDFDQALALCDQAVALGLGGAYVAKRASIERMM